MSDLPVPPQIIHVDDDEDVRDQAREYLQKEEIPSWGRPTVTSVAAFSDALGELETRRCDLIILDVRLGGHDPEDAPPDEEEGLRTLAAIRSRRFVPIVFWTGLPGKVGHLAGPVVRVVDKGAADPLGSLLEAVRASFATRLPLVNRSLIRLIEDEQRRYMWDFVAQHWEELEADGDHLGVACLLAQRLGRSLSGPGIRGLAATLGHLGENEPDEGKIHAAEMYITPPIEGSSHGVADLLRDGSEAESVRWWLILTPSCDLETRHGKRKAEGVLLAPCLPLREHPDVQALSRADNAGNRQKVKALLSQATDGQRDRYLFLPAAPAIPDLVVDFQMLRSVSGDGLDAMERVASLASPFAEAVISRFVRYFGRVGTADLDAAALLEGVRQSLRNSAAERDN